MGLDHDDDEAMDDDNAVSSSGTLLTLTTRMEKRMSAADIARAQEAESAATILYPVRYITHAWTVDEEKARKKRDHGLDPTFDEVEAANLGGRSTWSHVVNTFLNASEIGRHGNQKKGGQLDPNERPLELRRGGIITVRLRDYKGSHPDKGIIRVFTDPRLGYDPIAAAMEDGALEWQREVLRRERTEWDSHLGVDAAHRDHRALPRSEEEARQAALEGFFSAD